MKKIIDTGEAPAAVGAYSQAVKAGELVFTSGQLPYRSRNGDVFGRREGAGCSEHEEYRSHTQS